MEVLLLLDIRWGALVQGLLSLLYMLWLLREASWLVLEFAMVAVERLPLQSSVIDHVMLAVKLAI